MNFLSLLNFKHLVAIVGCIALGFLYYRFSYWQNRAQSLELQLTSLTSQMRATQNELDRYKSKRPEIQEKIVTKYEKVYIDSNTCENTIESVKSLLKEFGE